MSINPFRPTLVWLPVDDQIRIDNRRNQQSVTSWRLIGSSYRNGRHLPGSTILELSGGGTRYYRDTVSVAAAIEHAETLGYDVSAVRAKTDEWVKTGR